MRKYETKGRCGEHPARMESGGENSSQKHLLGNTIEWMRPIFESGERLFDVLSKADNNIPKTSARIAGVQEFPKKK